MSSERLLPIELYLGEGGISRLEREVERVASRYEDIIGVIAVGSMLQGPPPGDFYIQKNPGRLGEVYESIRRPERRKASTSADSDLDLWVCTRDTAISRQSRIKVEMGGAALLEELASGTLKRGTLHWRDKKLSMFGRYYKNYDMYHDTASEPWMAHEFKAELEESLIHRMPSFVKNVSSSLSGSIPGSFIEVRAFPESLFHLRPDESPLSNGTEDRAPFPRIMDEQWLGTSHNAHILYDKGVDIFPFAKDGDILGSYISEHVDYMAEREGRKSSLGAIMLKPDSVCNDEFLPVIRKKIQDKVASEGGNIVIEKKIDKLSDEQIESIYPFMPPEDFSDLKDYLQSGAVIIMVIELPVDSYGVFSLINSIKGPRVADRTLDRLYEGRRDDLAVRDLLPLPGDEDRYRSLISTILRKRVDPAHRFSDDDYSYYAKNLIHTPDNSVDLRGILSMVNPEIN